MDIIDLEVGSSTVAQLFKLPQHIIDYLWERIEVAKKKSICVKEMLAGNISQSYHLDDPQNLIVHNLFDILHNNSRMSEFIKSEINKIYDRTDYENQNHVEPYLLNMWVNFQKRGEFQPLHTHKGIFSFVIWMEIPYHHNDESDLSFTKGTMNGVTGNFSFVYSLDQSREVLPHIIRLSPVMNGYCCFFPSDLSHQVYPFYTSNKDRISISGNIACRRTLE
jgi:hypothetical protein